MTQLMASIAANPKALLASVSTIISPGDTMINNRNPSSVNHYYECGADATGKICGILSTLGLGEPASILDFACGYGRVARFMRAAFPNAEIYVSDLPEEATRFCAEHFGAVAFPSRADISTLVAPKKFSLIWCGSLLTHLDELGAAELLRFFSRSLADDGVAVFTSCGRRTASFVQKGRWPYQLNEEQMRFLHDQFLIERYALVAQGKRADYGISITPLSWFAKQIRELENVRLVSMIESGWDNHQDIVAIQKRGI